MRLVILPVALVGVAVRVHELPVSVGLIVLPESLVARAVGPDLGAEAVAVIVEPLACVDSPIFESNWPPGDPAVLVELLALLGHQKVAILVEGELVAVVGVVIEGIPAAEVVVDVAHLLVQHLVLGLALVQRLDLRAIVPARVAVISARSHSP